VRAMQHTISHSNSPSTFRSGLLAASGPVLLLVIVALSTAASARTTFGGWTMTGGWSSVGYDTYQCGEAETGVIRSAPVNLTRPCIIFTAAGADGQWPSTAGLNRFYLKDSVTGEILAQSSPPCSNDLYPMYWDVAAHRGRSVVFEAVDGYSGTGWSWMRFTTPVQGELIPGYIKDACWVYADPANDQFGRSAFGSSFLDTRLSGQAGVGTIQSVPFVVKGNGIRFYVAGHDGRPYEYNNQSWVRLRDADTQEILKSEYAPGTNDFVEIKWNTTSFWGRRVVFEARDANPGNCFAWLSLFGPMQTDFPLVSGTVLINSGAEYTKSTSVSLAVDGVGEEAEVTQMRFSNNGSTWSAWEPYSTSKAWTLLSGDGLKTVYVQFKDALGTPSIGYKDTIILDTTPPSTPARPTDAGAWTQSTSLVFGWLPVTDLLSGLGGYNYSIGTTIGGSDVATGSVAADTVQVGVPGQVGKAYFCKVQAFDRAGNLSQWSSTSDGITVVAHASLSVAAAKEYPDGIAVGLSPRAVAGIFSDSIYIQDPDRTSGLRIIQAVPIENLILGELVHAGGILRSSPSGERFLEATTSRVP
jgi:hypothetical protein